MADCRYNEKECLPVPCRKSILQTEMDRRNFAFGRMNFILLAVGMVVVILGFILMSGGGTDDKSFNPEIFSALRIKVAPVVCFVGFVSMIYAIMYKPKDDAADAKGENDIIVKDNRNI